ncbi:unnamed protein product [Spodoptera exigua]|nr:unnamed protein product [Spodoptera exigua]
MKAKQKRANRKSSSPTVLSALEDSSTTSHPSYISKTTANSVSVLQRGNSQESKPSPELHLRTEQDYYRQLEDYNEGYLVVFMMELARLVAVKADVRSILRHTDSILFESLKSGKLGSLGYPVTHVLLKFGVFVSDEPIAVVRMTRTSAEVCQSLVDSFFAPYRRLLMLEKRHILLDAINYMLKTRFPNRNQSLKIL